MKTKSKKRRKNPKYDAFRDWMFDSLTERNSSGETKEFDIKILIDELYFDTRIEISEISFKGWLKRIAEEFNMSIKKSESDKNKITFIHNEWLGVKDAWMADGKKQPNLKQDLIKSVEDIELNNLSLIQFKSITFNDAVILINNYEISGTFTLKINDSK